MLRAARFETRKWLQAGRPRAQPHLTTYPPPSPLPERTHGWPCAGRVPAFDGRFAWGGEVVKWVYNSPFLLRKEIRPGGVAKCRGIAVSGVRPPTKFPSACKKPCGMAFLLTVKTSRSAVLQNSETAVAQA